MVQLINTNAVNPISRSTISFPSLRKNTWSEACFLNYKKLLQAFAVSLESTSLLDVQPLFFLIYS